MVRNTTRQRAVVSLVGCFIVALLGAPPAGAERVWLAPVNVARPASQAQDAQVAIDEQNRAIAAWVDDRGARSADRPPGRGWQAPVVLGSAGAQGLRLAVGPQGGALAAWSQFAYSNLPYPIPSVYGVVRPRGGSWQAPVALAASQGSVITKSRGLSAGTDVAVDRHGNGLVAWKFIESISAAAVSANGTWAMPVGLGGVPQDGSTPRVGVDGAGNATTVWSTGSPSAYEPEPEPEVVLAAVRPAGASWQRAQVSATARDARGAQIAVNARGDAIATWTASDDHSSIVQAAVRSPQGVWQPPVDVSAPGRISGLRIAVDAAANAVAVWARLKGERSVVQGAVLPAGGAWSAPVNVSSSRAPDDSVPEVAMDARGNAIVVWTASRRDLSHVQSAVRPAGGGWSSPVNLSGADGYGPQIAFGPQGDATAIWSRRKDGGRTVIQTADFADGPRISRLRASARSVRYKLNVAARVRFTVQRVSRGRRLGERCVRPTRTRRKLEPCTRVRSLRGRLSDRGSAGANRLAIRGRLAGRALAPGRYRLIASPTARGRTGLPVQTGFRLAR